VDDEYFVEKIEAVVYLGHYLSPSLGGDGFLFAVPDEPTRNQSLF
jgi:hypothetical protein